MKKLLTLCLLILSIQNTFGQTPIRLYNFLEFDYLQNAASTKIDSAKWRFDFNSQYRFLLNTNPTYDHKIPSFVGAAHLRIKDVGTISFLATNDNYSFFNRTSIGIGYSTRYEKNGWFLQPGFRVIGNIDNYNLSKIHISGVESTNRVQTKLLADIDAGLTMGWRKLEVQLAYNNLCKTNLEVNRQTIISNKPNWLINVRYRFDLGEKWELTPFIQMYNERATSYDIGVQTGIKSKFHFGYQIRLINLYNIYHINFNATKDLQIRVAAAHSLLTKDIVAEVGLSYKLYK